MLISSTPPSVTYVYTGGSTYSVPFAFYGKETIKVSYSPPPTPGQLDIEPFIPMVYAIDYNVDGTLASPHDGTDAFKYGSVTLTSAGRNKLSNGTKILVSRRTPAEQKFAYGELDNFPAKSHENALGHLTVVAQELRQDIVRTLQVPEGVADPQGVLSYLFDVAVRAEEELRHSLRIAENLNDLENKATARNNLGLGSAATRNIGNAAGQVLTAGSATISTSHPLAGGGALGNNLTLYINSATAATATANGSSGSVVYAADNNTTARNMAATPAGVAKQVNDAVVSAGSVPPGRTIATSAPLAGGGDLSANRTLSINAAGAATATASGTPGSVTYAPDNNTTARNMAATPAGVAAQIALNTKANTSWASGDKIITVADSGADFTTVMGAIAEAMKWRSIDGSVIVEIQSGYLVTEQLFFIDNDYSHINIKAQNGATITVDHSSMSVTDFEGLGYSGFILCARGKSPMFHAQFEFLTRPANTISGALAVFNGQIYFGNNSGVKKAGVHGARGTGGGSVTMGSNNDFSGAGASGASAFDGGSVTMGSNNDFSGAGTAGAYSGNGGSVTMGSNNDFSGAGTYSFFVDRNGFIQAGTGTIFASGRERNQSPRTITAAGLIMG